MLFTIWKECCIQEHQRLDLPLVHQSPVTLKQKIVLSDMTMPTFKKNDTMMTFGNLEMQCTGCYCAWPMSNIVMFCNTFMTFANKLWLVPSHRSHRSHRSHIPMIWTYSVQFQASQHLWTALHSDSIKPQPCSPYLSHPTTLMWYCWQIPASLDVLQGTSSRWIWAEYMHLSG